jgi:hypothetical protein
LAAAELAGPQVRLGLQQRRDELLVAADGEPRTGRDLDPDLFWRCAAAEAAMRDRHRPVNLFPVAEAYAGALLFSPDVTEEGLRAPRLDVQAPG